MLHQFRRCPSVEHGVMEGVGNGFTVVEDSSKV
jgi:hypothetical protein